jgi:hypothetical protein
MWEVLVMARSFSRPLFGFLLIAALPLSAWGEAPATKRTAKEPPRTVELFPGMESGDIEVKVIPKDATEGTVLIKNTTDKPLTVQLPEAFAGVPVLAQGGFGGGGFGGCMGMGGGGGGMQGFGGGMGGGMGGCMMGGGGMFNVPADKVVKVKIVIVCLDHGKKDPNPRVPYNLVPIESYAKDAEVIELVKLLVRQQIDQHSAQAAVWHLQNGLSWEELARKIGARHINGTVEPYFTVAHLERAFEAVRIARERAENLPAEVAPSRSIGEELAKSP